jgi:Fe-S-cluster containining protein
MAGFVEVSMRDVRRLAKHLGMTVPAFEKKHLVSRRAGRRRIKNYDETCQFLGEDRRCTVYDARPTHCRGYVCWDRPDRTVYEFASMALLPVRTLRRLERQEASRRSARS